ncbi:MULTISPECIES: DUF2788 domain-containing protein [Modicisalibacter]|uniref:DUF2788 domain-containing protein n=1 Tax=Modicisalibacter TaxID=574347 RepID=UPI00100BFAE8|nr:MULTISPECIES: DUF2788 domain-containing protein [Halomonadaceae]MBZ9556890.1 DUF2788 domain-containing protein [Modicisalibacter sp. R2A 31.J]MBZ9574449.1 DUF2788 domain-containing protein [Modicisalibacter sp. MOD 31.J]
MDQTFETWATPLMIGGLILFMGFIIWDLARQSRAGRFGSVMLFMVLGAGLLAFVIKVVITYLMESGGGL